MRRFSGAMAGWLLWGLVLAVASPAPAAADPPPVASPHAVNTQRAGDEPPAAADLVRGFRLPDGFRAVLFAAEPDVSQPIAMTTDDRGRLWVVENYSYPQWRTTGVDRVLVFEDADADGRFDSRKVFLDGGRNLTGIEIGRGGVWLLSTPELVFVPDRDRDDVPDGPPEPVLDGFNIDRIAHNVVSGLRWGPDGWLYGRHGIKAISHVGRPDAVARDRVAMDCGIWRVHPESRRFEVVVRGTTNPWGLDYDDLGEMVFTNNVTGHLWHVVPGSHFERMYGFDPEPHVYELLPQSADHLHWPGGKWQISRPVDGRQDATVDALGGGHSHCGGMIYLGDMFPDRYRGRMFMCNTHGKRVNVDRLEHGPRGVVGRHDADFLLARDTWFRGIELVSGPDGRVWIADWTDSGECHDYDGVHRASGRIYTVLYGEPTGDGPPVKPLDFHAADDAALVELQLHRNDWFCRQARRILADRAAAGRDCSAAAAAARRMAETHADPTRRLRGMWAAQAIGSADREWLRDRLDDPHPSVRAWAVRLIVDDPSGSAVSAGEPAWIGGVLTDLAAAEPMGLVRLHLAGTLGRLPHEWSFGVAERLSRRAEDADWNGLATLIWHGLRDAVAADPRRGAALAATTTMPRLRRLVARRLAFDADRSAPMAEALTDLVRSTAGGGDGELDADVLVGISQAWQGRRRAVVPDALRHALEAAVAKMPSAAEPHTPGTTPDRLAEAKRVIAVVLRGEAQPVAAASAETLAVAADIAKLQAAAPSTPAARGEAISRWREKLTPDAISRADLSAGRVIWRQRCGSCHMLFGEGGKVGPDLTGSGRSEPDYVILNVIDPSAVVPEGWRLTRVLTGDGRVLAGALVASDERTLTLRTVTGDVAIDREDVEEVVTEKQSVMPEGLWTGLDEDQVRDLVGYLASPVQVGDGQPSGVIPEQPGSR